MVLFCGKPRQGEGSQRKPPCSGTMGWLQLFHCLPAVRSDKTVQDQDSAAHSQVNILPQQQPLCRH
uniref:Uncharacterized protein n=1 Tax=Anguilla anguilla TaxID=7936 RepID=A0A0E9UMN0_ANGAN